MLHAADNESLKKSLHTLFDNDADIGSLKSLRTLFDKYLDYMLVKFKQNRMERNKQILELFGKKMKTIFDKVLTPFWKTFL